MAFSLARRDQLGLDPARLDRALEAVTDQDLRRVAAEVFAPGRHAGAIAGSANPAGDQAPPSRVDWSSAFNRGQSGCVATA